MGQEVFYPDIGIKCPFYEKGDSRFIQCEGLNDKCSTRIIFKDAVYGNALREERFKYSTHYCMEHYEDCILYKALYSKYEETK